jgi:hypothetical protein
MRWALFKLIEFIGLNKLIHSRKWSKVNGGKMEAGKVGSLKDGSWDDEKVRG